jgi:hypothetical protein
VVIGGISLFGGRGSIMGALFGALIVGVFTLGLRLLGADAQWTFLLIGVLIIAAVASISGSERCRPDGTDPQGARAGEALWQGHRARSLRLRSLAMAKSWPSLATMALASPR